MSQSTLQTSARQAQPLVNRIFSRWRWRQLHTRVAWTTLANDARKQYKAKTKGTRAEENPKPVVRSQIAIIPWGIEKDIAEVIDPHAIAIFDRIEKQFDVVEILPGNIRSFGIQGWKEVPMKLVIEDLRSMGIKKVAIFASRSGESFQEFCGDLSIAGIEINVVPIMTNKGRFEKTTPVPCTRKHRKDPKTGWNPKIYDLFPFPRHDSTTEKWADGIAGELAPLTGKWMPIAEGVYKWKEPKWTVDELANSEFLFGSLIMWSAEDYIIKHANGKKSWSMHRPIVAEELIEKTIREANQTEWNALGLLNRRYFSLLAKHSWHPTAGEEYEPIVPPNDVTYPHELDLVGFRFSEVPARRFDYLVGQDWIYGEFGQRVRAWHDHLNQTGQLARFEDKSMLSDLKSDSTGYWNDKDEYVYTGCQEGKSIKQYPVWLTPRDRFGKPLRKPRVKFNEQLRDSYAAGLEKKDFQDIEDPMPNNWQQGVPWAFEGQDDGTYERQTEKQPRSYTGQNLSSVREEQLEESDSLEGEEGTHYFILDEAEDFVRKNTDDAKWIYNADMHVAKAIERAKDKAVLRGMRARVSGNEEEIFEAKWKYKNACKEWPEQRKRAEKKAEAHAWYQAVELLQGMERIREQTSAKPGEDRNWLWNLHRQLENIAIQITPMLKEFINQKRGDAKQSMCDLLREEYAATKKLLKEVGTQLRGDEQTQQIADVLREHPEMIYALMKFDYGLLIKTLREHRDLKVPADLIDEARKYHKVSVQRFPELYTKKGKQRVNPIHNRVAKQLTKV